MFSFTSKLVELFDNIMSFQHSVTNPTNLLNNQLLALLSLPFRVCHKHIQELNIQLFIISLSHLSVHLQK